MIRYDLRVELNGRGFQIGWATTAKFRAIGWRKIWWRFYYASHQDTEDFLNEITSRRACGNGLSSEQ